MEGGFAAGSRSQRAMLLHFPVMEEQDLTLLDFVCASQVAGFRPGVETSDASARTVMEGAMDNVGLFLDAVTGNIGFRTAIQPLCRDLRQSPKMWRGISDVFILYQLRLLLDAFTSDVRCHKQSTQFSDKPMSTAEECVSLLECYVTEWLDQAKSCTGEWSEKERSQFRVPGGIFDCIRFNGWITNRAAYPAFRHATLRCRSGSDIVAT